MVKIKREVYGQFVRLDRADPELSAVETIEVYAVAARAKDALARDLLLDPLRVLIDHQVDGIDDDWQVTVNRVNAEVSVPPNPGVHHIIFLLTAIRANKHAHGIYYRMPPPGDKKRAKG